MSTIGDRKTELKIPKDANGEQESMDKKRIGSTTKRKVTMTIPQRKSSPRIRLSSMSENGMIATYKCSYIPIEFLNLLRVTMMCDVPTMAFESAHILSGNILPRDASEMLGRINYLPIHSDHAKYFSASYECPAACGSHCLKCAVYYTLNLTYDEKTALERKQDIDACDGLLEITHRDLKPINPDSTFILVDTAKYGVPLHYLLPGQSIHLFVWARKGVSRHTAIGQPASRYSPVTGISIRDGIRIAIDREMEKTLLSPSQRMVIAARCPKKVFEFDEVNHRIELSRPNACTQCGVCIELTNTWTDISKRHHPCIIIESDPRHFELNISTNGSLNAADVLDEGIRILLLRLERLRVSFDKLDHSIAIDELKDSDVLSTTRVEKLTPPIETSLPDIEIVPKHLTR